MSIFTEFNERRDIIEKDSTGELSSTTRRATTLRTLIQSFYNEELILNIHNRKLKQQKIKEISSNFDMAASGTLLVSKNKTTGKVILMDGHHRLLGLILAYESGLLSDSFLSNKIDIYFSTWRERYNNKRKRDAVSKQTSKDFITSLDMAAGSLVFEIINNAAKNLGFDKKAAQEVIPNRVKETIFDMYAAYTRKNKEVTIETIFSVRTDVTKERLREMSKEELNLPLPLELNKKMVNAVQIYLEFLVFNSKNSENFKLKTNYEEIKSILRLAGFAQILFCEAFSDSPKILEQGVKYTLERMYKLSELEVENLAELIKKLGKRTGIKDINKTINIIEELMIKQKYNKKQIKDNNSRVVEKLLKHLDNGV